MRRADGIDVTVYRSGNQLIELAHAGGGFGATAWVLPTTDTPVGDPAAYVRADGVSAVVYRNSNNHIIELSLLSNWVSTDLTAQLPGAGAPSSDPTAFVRSDGYSSVVYRSGNQIFELYHSRETHRWDWGQPSALVSNGPAPAAIGKPSGYVHHDGWNAIVYRSTDQRVIELWLDGYGWHYGALTPAPSSSLPGAVGDPAPYVQSDAHEAVAYRASNGGPLYNLSFPMYQVTNTSDTGWTPAALGASGSSDPQPYLRGSTNTVVFSTIGRHAWEVAKPLLTTWWTAKDLSAEAGE